jgi:CMP-N,N'-diacetyllegionaminic acid synthase
MKKLVIIIPARKGSRRLKNKNIIKLGSKNLVERTIIFAKKLVKKNCIILSTDSKKICHI